MVYTFENRQVQPSAAISNIAATEIPLSKSTCYQYDVMLRRSVRHCEQSTIF